MDMIKKFNLKKLLTVLATLTLCICMVFGVACDGTSSDSSSSSSSSDDTEDTVTATDYQVVKNGDFEFGTSGDSVTYPVYTGINWTRYRDNTYSSSAVSSTKNSGIIDTEEEAYNKIAEGQNFPKEDEGFWNPHTPAYYKLGGERYDDSDFENNPNEDKLVTEGTKILMIHNVTSEAKRGTAQKFVSSSSLTTSTGYGKLSVWVLTKDLQSLQEDTEEYGAYISVASTLSSSRSPLVVKNIDTKGVWAEYVIYVKTSDYASSSFTVTVGLGFGSDTYKKEYVEGFAYFDDIHFEEIEESVFEQEASTATEYNIFDVDSQGNLVEKDKAQLIADQSTIKGSYLANTVVAEQGQATQVKLVYSHLVASNPLTLTYTGDYNKVYEPDKDAYATGAESGVASFDTLGFTGLENPAGATAQTAYIKLSTPSSYTLTSSLYTIESGAYKQFKFYTNADVELTGQPGATIKVEEVNSDGSKVFGDSTVASNYETYSSDDDANVWKTVCVFVKNQFDTDRYIRFTFTLGTTDSVFDAALYNLTQGYALFTGFEEKSLSESEYNVASSSADYKTTISLGYEFPNGADEDEEEENESFAFSASYSSKGDISVKPSYGVIGYTGVVGGHTMVGGQATNYSDANVVSGIVNSKYASSYASLSDDEKTVISNLASKANAVIQPIIVKNNYATSYGYLGSQLTLSANSTTLITVQVKALDNANAYVYLANADPLSTFNVLTVNDNQLFVKVGANDLDGWTTVSFVVTTGDQALTYRVELWNGSRDGSEASQGTVLFNQVTTSSTVNLTGLKAQMENEFVETPADVVTVSYTRVPTTIKYTDSDGNEATRTQTYAPTVVFTQYVKGNTIIATYETIDAPTEIDETTTTEEEEEEEEETTTTDPNNQLNWGLQLATIIIAAALVVALIAVVVRMIVKKHKKVETNPNNYYNRNSREQAQAIINANKAKRAAKAKEEQEQAEAEANAEAEATTEAEVEDNETEAEEVPAYDYDNPENNV